MIAEVLLVLAGHDSSLFPTDHTLHPAFTPLLHPGEQQCLEALGKIAGRYRSIKDLCTVLSSSSSPPSSLSSLKPYRHFPCELSVLSRATRV